MVIIITVGAELSICRQGYPGKIPMTVWVKKNCFVRKIVELIFVWKYAADDRLFFRAANLTCDGYITFSRITESVRPTQMQVVCLQVNSNYSWKWPEHWILCLIVQLKCFLWKILQFLCPYLKKFSWNLKLLKTFSTFLLSITETVRCMSFVYKLRNFRHIGNTYFSFSRFRLPFMNCVSRWTFTSCGRMIIIVCLSTFFPGEFLLHHQKAIWPGKSVGSFPFTRFIVTVDGLLPTTRVTTSRPLTSNTFSLFPEQLWAGGHHFLIRDYLWGISEPVLVVAS